MGSIIGLLTTIGFFVFLIVGRHVRLWQVRKGGKSPLAHRQMRLNTAFSSFAKMQLTVRKRVPNRTMQKYRLHMCEDRRHSEGHDGSKETCC